MINSYYVDLKLYNYIYRNIEEICLEITKIKISNQ